MTNQLKADDLDGAKLIESENLPPLHVVQAALDHTYMQASQGWGVTREVAVYAFLALELKSALEIAETADENRRMLKGAQLETGRLKKKIEKIEAELLAAELQVTELRAKLQVREAPNEESKGTDSTGSASDSA